MAVVCFLSLPKLRKIVFFMKRLFFLATIASSSFFVGAVPSFSTPYQAGGGTANKAGAVAIGEGATADNIGAVAIGKDADANFKAVAIGEEANANANSVSIGDQAEAGFEAVAIGAGSKADGENSTALGFRASAEYENSTAVGMESVTKRSNQIVLGSKTTELTISNLEGTNTGVTYVESDGTLRRSSVTANMLEGFDGRIDKLGDGVAASTALTSAMGALPTISPDSKITCGVGTGAYSGATAVALGCASRINDRLSVNIGGSKVLQGSSSYEYGSGSLDSFAARAGLVVKLGKIHESTTSSQELQVRIQQFEAENLKISNENLSIKWQNAEINEKYSLIEQQNRQLMARLERLEAIATGLQLKSDHLAVIPTTGAE